MYAYLISMILMFSILETVYAQNTCWVICTISDKEKQYHFVTLHSVLHSYPLRLVHIFIRIIEDAVIFHLISQNFSL